EGGVERHGFLDVGAGGVLVAYVGEGEGVGKQLAGMDGRAAVVLDESEVGSGEERGRLHGTGGPRLSAALAAVVGDVGSVDEHVPTGRDGRGIGAEGEQGMVDRSRGERADLEGA